MNIGVAFIAALVPFGLVATAQGADPRWEAAADLGVVHTVGSAPIFDWAVCGGGSLLVRLRQRFGVGMFAEYRQIVDSPASTSSFWYADVGVRGRFMFTQRLWVRLDAGWSFRHIGLPDGYSNTVGGLMAGGGLGAILVARSNWNLNLAATYHYTKRFPSEFFATNDIGLDAGWAWKW
jgi:hypothetical protein